jgi:Universal stress protein family
MSLIAAALKPGSILIATDFSDASEKALRYSLALARFYESKFCLVHVVSSLAGCGKTRFEASTVPQDSLVSTKQSDKKRVCVDKTSSSWTCSAT